MPQKQQLTSDEREKKKLISGVELFSTLLDDDLSYVSSRTGFRIIPVNTIIFSAGETAWQFFIIKSGSVSITSTVTGSRPLELARYVNGDVFGDFHFVINAPYNATALSLEKTELLVFPQDGLTFDRISDEKPDTASRILLRSISMIASRLSSTNQLISENTPWIRELRKQIYTDPPTGLWNKAYMDSELPQLLPGSAAVLMVKPDKFKELNDSLGHAEGDVILGKIAALLIKVTKKNKCGWAVRLRSNEMCLIMPNMDLKTARALTKEIHSSFPGMVPKQKGGESLLLTASIAVGFWPEDNPNWLQAADETNKVMQDVWKSGGNRTVLLREAGNEKS